MMQDEFVNSVLGGVQGSDDWQLMKLQQFIQILTSHYLLYLCLILLMKLKTCTNTGSGANSVLVSIVLNVFLEREELIEDFVLI